MIQKRARNKLRYMEDPNYEYGTPNWQSLNAIYHAAIMQRKILFNVKWKPNIAASFHLRVWLFNPSTPQAPQRCNLTRKFNLAQRLIQNEEKSVGKTFFFFVSTASFRYQLRASKRCENIIRFSWKLNSKSAFFCQHMLHSICNNILGALKCLKKWQRQWQLNLVL